MSQISQIVGSIFLACVPALLWGYIFYKKNPQDRRLTFLTFSVGALAVFPILLYKALWSVFPWINAFRIADRYETTLLHISDFVVIPVSVIITFMLVGVIEEVMKMFAVKAVDDDEFMSIDDCMEFFIIAALGFSFTENILYFYNIWLVHGAHDLIVPFIFRSSFSTFAHLMFSGVLGYYYGVAHFAKPILQDHMRQNRTHWTKAVHKLFGWRTEKVFHEEKLLEGLIFSIVLHALFNIFLEMQFTYMIVPFLIAGYMTLNHLFNLKENHKKYGMVYDGVRNHQMANRKLLPAPATELENHS